MPFTRFFSYFFQQQQQQPKALIIGFSQDRSLLTIQHDKEQKGYKCHVVYVGEDGTLKIPHLEITTNDLVIIVGHGERGTERMTASFQSNSFITASTIAKAIQTCLSTANPPKPLRVQVRCCYSPAAFTPEWLKLEYHFIDTLSSSFKTLNINHCVSGYFFEKPAALIIGFRGDTGLWIIQRDKEAQGYKCHVVYVEEDGTLKIPDLEITTNDIVIIAAHGRWGKDLITAPSEKDNFITASAIAKAIHRCLNTANPPEPLIVEARCCHSAAGDIPYREQWLNHENSFIGILYANFQALNIKTRITGYLFGVNPAVFFHKKETSNEEYPIIHYIEKSESENILYCQQYKDKFWEIINEVYKNSPYDNNISKPINRSELEFRVGIPMIAAAGSTVILTTPGLPLPPSLQFTWREQNDVVISYPFGYPIMDAPEYLLRRKEELPNRSAFIFPDEPDITTPIVYSNEKQKKLRKKVLEKYAIVRKEITSKYAEIVCNLKTKYTDSLDQDFNNQQFKKVENYLVNWSMDNYLEYCKPGVNFLLSDPAITAQCLRSYIQENLERDEYSNPPLMKMFFQELIGIIQDYNGYYLQRYSELEIGNYYSEKLNRAYLSDLERLAFFHGNLYCRLPPAAGPDTSGEKSKEKTALTASGSAIRPT